MSVQIFNRAPSQTSNILTIFIEDSASPGNGKTGLAFNTASLIAYYNRNGDATATAISLVTMTAGTFTSGGFVEIDATHLKGWYQFCPPDACFAGGDIVSIGLQGATGMLQCAIICQQGAALTATERTAAATSLLTYADGVETGYTPQGALRIMLSALAAKLSGAATSTVTIRNVTDAKNRITATVDASGNRTAVTLDAS